MVFWCGERPIDAPFIGRPMRRSSWFSSGQICQRILQEKDLDRLWLLNEKTLSLEETCSSTRLSLGRLLQIDKAISEVIFGVVNGWFQRDIIRRSCSTCHVLENLKSLLAAVRELHYGYGHRESWLETQNRMFALFEVQNLRKRIKQSCVAVLESFVTYRCHRYSVPLVSL